MADRLDSGRLAGNGVSPAGRGECVPNSHGCLVRGDAKEAVETTYTVGGGSKAKKVGELIISG